MVSTDDSMRLLGSGLDLVGRRHELEQLKQACRCDLSHSKHNEEEEVRLVLITGEDGSGKTALVETLKDVVERDNNNGIVVVHRFDALKKASPSRIISNAFAGVVQAALESDDGPKLIKEIQERLANSMKASHVVLTNFLRELEEVVAHPLLLRDEKYISFNQRACGTYAFSKFLEVYDSFNRSVVLAFENIHWADKDTIERLSSLLFVCRAKNVMLVCTSVNPMVEFQHHSTTVEIKIPTMSLDETQAIVEHAAAANATIGNGVVGRIHELTEGNAAFINQTIHFLRSRSAIGDLAKVETCLRGCNTVDDIVRHRFESLDEETQEALQSASLLGSTVNRDVLSKVLSFPIEAALKVSVDEGFLVACGEELTLAFVNDCVHRAIKGSIREDTLPTRHYKLGQKLLESLSEEDIESGLIFEAMDQLRHGEARIKSRADRELVASMCLKVSHAAVTASSFRVALIYLELGIRLVENPNWKHWFDLNLALHNACIEISTSMGNLERAEQLQNVVLRSTTCFNDQIHAKMSKMNTLGARGLVRHSAEEGIAMLKHLGISLQIEPTLARLLLTLRKTKRALKNKSDEAILRMPIMTDSLKLSTMQLFVILMSSSYQLNNSLTPLVILRGIQFTLKFGLCGASSVMFALYGMLQCGLKNYDEGHRYGKLGLRLLDEKRCTAFTARVYTVVYTYIFTHNVPYQQLEEPVKLGYTLGMETGDIDFATNCMGMSVILPWNAGVSNSSILKKAPPVVALMRSRKQETRLNLGLSFQRMVVNLVAGYDGMSKDQLEYRYEDCEAWSLWSHGHNALLAYFYKDYILAEAECDRAMQMNKTMSGPDIAHIYMTHVLIAVALVANGDTTRSKRRRLAAARNSLNLLRKLGRVYSTNCLDRLAVAETDYVAITKGVKTEVFMKGVGVCLVTNWTMGSALIHELWGRHLMREGDSSAAILQLQQSISFYLKWGATGKVAQLQEEFPKLGATVS